MALETDGGAAGVAPHEAPAVIGKRRSAVFVTPFIWEAGRGKGKPTVHKTMRGFIEAGYDVHAICPTNRPDLTESDIDGIRVHYVRLPLNAVPFDYDATRSFLTLVRSGTSRATRHLRFRLWWTQFVALGARRAMEVAERFDADLVYGVNNPGIPAAYRVARRRGIPAFARIMGSEIAQMAGVDLDADSLSRGGSGERSLRSGPLWRAALWPVRFDELLAFKLPCDAVIVTDDGQIGPRTITEWLGVPEERLWLWRNGIDKDRFLADTDRAAARELLDIRANHKVVLWVSQLIDWKGPDRLIDAIPAVAARHPEAHFVLVGDGPERGRLEADTHRLGVADKVRFVGAVTHEQIPPYYHAADVFTAFYNRANVSNTLLEAMLCGNAVVTLDNGRTREVVRDGESGLLVDPGRLADVSVALDRVLSDGALRQRLGAEAGQWADANLLTWDARIAREVEAIEEVLRRKAARR